jgi:tetratricopeptide (TPR) repeat protein
VWGRRARLEATVAFGEGDVPGCLEFGKKATEWDEGSGLSWEILGKGLEASMDVEGAAAAYKSSEQKFGDDVPIRIYLKLADLCVRAEAYEKAKEAAFKATKKYGSGAAWKIAAVASMKLGEWENARKCFEESLRIDPYVVGASERSERKIGPTCMCDRRG